MIESVHIPIFCNNPELKAGALLTLKTIRVGFPNLPIVAHCCGIDGSIIHEFEKVCKETDVRIRWSQFGRNDRLIKLLCESEQKGFAVVDSDVVFFDNCEDYDSAEQFPISGEYISAFDCPIAKAFTESRLHTAFFVVNDPVKLRDWIARSYSPLLPKFCPFDPYAPTVTFQNSEPVFFDSCSILYHAIGGTWFDALMLDKFQHCFSGSYADRLPKLHLDFLNSVYKDPSKAKGFREVMSQYFLKLQRKGST